MTAPAEWQQNAAFLLSTNLTPPPRPKWSPPTQRNQTPTRDPRGAVASAKLLSRLSWTVPGAGCSRQANSSLQYYIEVQKREPEWRQKCSDAGSSLKYLQLPGASKVYSRQACPQGSGRCGTGNLVYHRQVIQAKGLTDGTQLILRIPDLLLNLKLPAIQTPGPAQARQARLCHRRASKPGIV